MNRALAQSAAVMLMGIVLILNQGCSAKSLKSESEGERVSGSVGTTPLILGENSSEDTNLLTTSKENSSSDTNLPFTFEQSSNNDRKLPPLSEQRSSGELSGFSHNPSEEQLAEGEDFVAQTPSVIDPRQRAELTKEEKAAGGAGLRDVFFGFDHWTLSDTGIDALNHDAAYLHNHPETVLKIEGHCDERGTGEYNMVLGDKRAKAARNYLLEALVKPEQLTIVSYGKERPFCSDPDESCYEQNRRSHMLLTINDESTP